MRSIKPVKTLKELIVPFSFIPSETVSGNINGKKIFVEKGKVTTLAISEYETLLNSEYGHILKN